MPPSKRTSSHHQNQTNHFAKTQNHKNLNATDKTEDLTPQTSITVASRTMPVRARSISSLNCNGSPLSSTHSSPQVASPELSKSTKSTIISPNHTAIAPLPDSAEADMANSTTPASRQILKPQPVANYESLSNLEEITMRQLEEDISAYQHDEAFCLAQLEEPDLTPQETRTLQLRVLDLSHQVRHCRHRIETIQFQVRKNNRPLAGGLRPAYAAVGAPLVSSSSTPATNGTNGGHVAARQYQVNGAKHPSSSGNPGGVIVRKGGATPVPSNKRMADSEESDQGHLESGEAKKIKTGDSSPAAVEYEMQVDRSEDGENINTTLQRLGFWKCRLCSAPKYLLAGSGKSPAAPCKWPLKDISKMITHFTEMHAEHSASERCVELGSALAQNRGPFEYWLRRTRSQNIGDGTMLDECIASLLQGEMPILLRRHSRAAASMASD
ncbi:hypothetical protein QBC42DRAFT_275504 [Cladorrhinum samala]|uniref:Uncharacterized protein n=1 Tax=Cladorrhinum samala TaxID=585594 RepID=A0AAV9HHP3_9PEZI|nr:hypothetical protein QBC42DRAFT_275504 [Cladorrhinum samala]